MEKIDARALVKKWGKFISKDTYKDIRSDYDALQIAILLENTYSGNRKDILEETKARNQLLEDSGDGSNYVPINGMQPSLILPIMRRMYPKIMMKNFVSTQTLPTPNAVVHYLKRVFQTAKNGVDFEDEFTGLPSQYDKLGAFDPFFSSELVKGASLTNGGAGHEKELTLALGTVNYYNEQGVKAGSTVIDPNDLTKTRRIVCACAFETTNGSYLNGWLVRGRNSAGYTGGIDWKVTFLPVSKYVDGDDADLDFVTPTDDEFVVSVTDGVSLKFTYSGTDYIHLEAGWFDRTAGTAVDDTAYGYYSVDPRLFPQIMPEMGIQIETMPITLKERNYKVRYNPKEEKVFQDYVNLNLASELVNEISDQMAYEIDREIKLFIEMNVIEDLREYVDVSAMKVSTTHGTFYDPMIYLMFRIELFAAKMERINKMGRPNVALISPNIAAMLNHITTFKLVDDEVSHPAGGIYKMGSIPGKMDYYVDPQSTDDVILLAHKHNGNPFGAGIVFAPYFSFLTPEIWDGSTANKTRIMIMQYGLEMVPYGEYLYGAITVSGITSIWS